MASLKEKKKYLESTCNYSDKIRFDQLNSEYVGWYSYIPAPGMPPQALYKRSKDLSTVEDHIQEGIKKLFQLFKSREDEQDANMD